MSIQRELIIIVQQQAVFRELGDFRILYQPCSEEPDIMTESLDLPVMEIQQTALGGPLRDYMQV